MTEILPVFVPESRKTEEVIKLIRILENRGNPMELGSLLLETKL